MEIVTALLWILAALLVIAGLAGLVLPAVPGAPVIFAGLGLALGVAAKLALAFAMLAVFAAARFMM